MMMSSEVIDKTIHSIASYILWTNTNLFRIANFVVKTLHYTSYFVFCIIIGRSKPKKSAKWCCTNIESEMEIIMFCVGRSKCTTAL